MLHDAKRCRVRLVYWNIQRKCTMNMKIWRFCWTLHTQRYWFTLKKSEKKMFGPGPTGPYGSYAYVIHSWVSFGMDVWLRLELSDCFQYFPINGSCWIKYSCYGTAIYWKQRVVNLISWSSLHGGTVNISDPRSDFGHCLIYRIVWYMRQ